MALTHQASFKVLLNRLNHLILVTARLQQFMGLFNITIDDLYIALHNSLIAVRRATQDNYKDTTILYSIPALIWELAVIRRN